MPFRVKFWRSLGPTESAAGAFVVVAGTSWASAVAGVSANAAPADNKIPKRETALICSRFAL